MEDKFLCRHESTGIWYQARDYCFTKWYGEWPLEKILEYNKINHRKMLRALFENSAPACWALIQDTKEIMSDGLRACLLVKHQDQDHYSASPAASKDLDLQAPLYVNILATTTLSEIRDSASILAWENFRGIAKVIAAHEATKNLLAIPDKDSEECRMVRIQLKLLMRDATREACNKDPGFARACEEKFEGRTRDTAWVTLPMMLPFSLDIKDLPNEQLWVVDEAGEAIYSEGC